MEHITLFTDILPEEQERMRVCFKVREKVFQNGETIMEYSSSMKKIGLIQEAEEFSKMCFDICDKLGLVKSGGSDFHGGNKPDVELGKVSGGYVPYEFLLNMKEQRGLM